MRLLAISLGSHYTFVTLKLQLILYQENANLATNKQVQPQVDVENYLQRLTSTPHRTLSIPPIDQKITSVLRHFTFPPDRIHIWQKYQKQNSAGAPEM